MHADRAPRRSRPKRGSQAFLPVGSLLAADLGRARPSLAT